MGVSCGGAPWSVTGRMSVAGTDLPPSGISGVTPAACKTAWVTPTDAAASGDVVDANSPTDIVMTFQSYHK